MYPAGLLWAMFAVVAFRSFYMVFEMAQVGGNNVFVAAHAGADGSAVRGGMQGEQGGGNAGSEFHDASPLRRLREDEWVQKEKQIQKPENGLRADSTRTSRY